MSRLTHVGRSFLPLALLVGAATASAQPRAPEALPQAPQTPQLPSRPTGTPAPLGAVTFTSSEITSSFMAVGPFNGKRTIFAGSPFFVRVRIGGLKSTTGKVKVALDAAKYGDRPVPTSHKFSHPSGAGQIEPADGYNAPAAGEAFEALLPLALPEDARGIGTALVIYLKVTEVRSGQPDLVHELRAGTVDFRELKRHTLTNTFALAAKNSFQLVKFRPGFGFGVSSSNPSVGDCEGVSKGPAGEFPVGISNANGRLKMSIRSGPAGTKCEYEAPMKLLVPFPWKILSVRMTSTHSGPCEAAPMMPSRRETQPGDLRTERLNAGEGTANFEALHFPSSQLPGLFRMILSCGNTLSNDRSATLTFDSIELVGPSDQTPDDAFRTSVGSVVD